MPVWYECVPIPGYRANVPQGFLVYAPMFPGFLARAFLPCGPNYIPASEPPVCQKSSIRILHKIVSKVMADRPDGR